MNAPATRTIAPLRGPILRSISRSFYLSIRFLPATLRDPVALAYLLARATDTIADTAGIDADLRLEKLERLAAFIQTGAVGHETGLETFAPLQKNTAERRLLEAVPDCLGWLESLPEADRVEIRQVLARINEGQRLDVERFGNSGQIAALQNAAELDHYTYLVAGAVGEFWTNICFRHLPRCTRRAQEEMIRLGSEYGKGLQLINVLRDAGDDLRAGRCYLPADELQSLGLEPAGILREPNRAKPALEAWRLRAEEGIQAGVDYSCALEPWRVRIATVLPALIGARTLSLLRTEGARSLATRVKISRAEVRQILLKTIAGLAAPPSLRRLFDSLSS